MNDEEICARFEQGLSRFLAEDIQLLQLDVNERCVGAALARCLHGLFPEHRVDAEYNRTGHELDSKTLELPPECRGGGRKRVFPDIIVHRRGDNQANLLVVEIKMETNHEPRACDLAKVAGYCAQLGYRVGVFVDLPAGPGAGERAPVLQWFKDGQ